MLPPLFARILRDIRFLLKYAQTLCIGENVITMRGFSIPLINIQNIKIFLFGYPDIFCLCSIKAKSLVFSKRTLSFMTLSFLRVFWLRENFKRYVFPTKKHYISLLVTRKCLLDIEYGAVFDMGDPLYISQNTRKKEREYNRWNAC